MKKECIEMMNEILGVLQPHTHCICNLNAALHLCILVLFTQSYCSQGSQSLRLHTNESKSFCPLQCILLELPFSSPREAQLQRLMCERETCTGHISEWTNHTAIWGSSFLVNTIQLKNIWLVWESLCIKSKMKLDKTQILTQRNKLKQSLESS